MKQNIYTVRSNEPIARDTYKMALDGDISDITCSGQFVQIAVEGAFLRRPISVSDVYDGGFVIVYKVVGKGTETLSRMETGEKLDIIVGLGNGFDAPRTRRSALLVGGSVGAAPLMLLAKELLLRGCEVRVALGFPDAETVFYEKEFREMCSDVAVATVDGSAGIKGLVTDAVATMEMDYDFFYACGPKPMLKALCECLSEDGQISMEERMGCGTGICYGCTCMTVNGPKRVCADGPVFGKEELVW